jgi:hypothetical protein
MPGARISRISAVTSSLAGESLRLTIVVTLSRMFTKVLVAGFIRQKPPRVPSAVLHAMGGDQRESAARILLRFPVACRRPRRAVDGYADFTVCSGNLVSVAIMGRRAAPKRPASVPSRARVMIVLRRAGRESSWTLVPCRPRVPSRGAVAR